MSNLSASQMFLIHQETNELSHCVSSCPVKNIRPTWCSEDTRNSYSLSNISKTLFSKTLCLSNFCQKKPHQITESKRYCFIQASLPPPRPPEIYIAIYISLLLVYVKSAGPMFSKCGRIFEIIYVKGTSALPDKGQVIGGWIPVLLWKYSWTFFRAQSLESTKFEVPPLQDIRASLQLWSAPSFSSVKWGQ